MFNGGKFGGEKEEQREQNFKSSMDVSDISGAKAKRRFSEIRNSQKLGNVGS